MRTGGELLVGWADPADVFERLGDPAEDAVLLEATDGTGVSILGFGSRVLHSVPDVPLAARDAGPGFDGGWIGWLTYEGEARFLEVDRVLVFDHARRAVRILSEDASWRREAAAAAASGGASAAVRSGGRLPPPIWRHDDARYLDMVRACQDAIVRGDAYVLCLTNTATVEGAIDAWSTYRRLRRTSPTHHAGYLRLGGTALVSASPERFVEVAPDGTVRSRPIKGTRPRSADPERDRALAEELASSEKERAENLMIVDLVRNDLSRVSAVGSVRVPHLFEVESYRSVHQLVSTIESRLAPGRTAADAIRSLFPAGSMTGAPKKSAIDILAALEEGPRGLYSGAFGWISRSGAADLAMTIRSIVVEPDRATVGAGGGITALSDPEEELAEVRLKAAPLLAAIADYP